MNSKTIVMCVVLFLIGMLLAHMLKNVCGCRTVEGLPGKNPDGIGSPCEILENMQRMCREDANGLGKTKGCDEAGARFGGRTAVWGNWAKPPYDKC